MIASLMSGLRRMRFTLVAIAAALSTALIITPVHAASEFSHVEGGTVAAICIIGTLVFALVFEIWHLNMQRDQHSQNEIRRH